MPTLTSTDTAQTTADRESAFFNELVQRGDFNPFMDSGWRTIGRRFEEWVTADGALDVLDIGCGTGQSRQLYIERANRYVGLDLSDAALAMARHKFPDDVWLYGDACQLPFESESFDVVAFSSVLHHIPDFGDALVEAFRVLRPGGRVFAFDPNLLHPAMALFRCPSSPCYLSSGVSPNERPLLPSVLRAAFHKAGFANLLQRAQSGISYRQVAPKLINALLSIYNAADGLFELSGLGRWFGTFVITCGQKPAGQGA